MADEKGSVSESGPVKESVKEEKFPISQLVKYSKQLFGEEIYVIAGVISFKGLKPANTATKEEFRGYINEFLNHSAHVGK